jgi:hypothetical protein
MTIVGNMVRVIDWVIMIDMVWVEGLDMRITTDRLIDRVSMMVLLMFVVLIVMFVIVILGYRYQICDCVYSWIIL